MSIISRVGRERRKKVQKPVKAQVLHQEEGVKDSLKKTDNQILTRKNPVQQLRAFYSILFSIWSKQAAAGREK